MTPPYSIVPLSTRHSRDQFDCGKHSLNDYLKRFARQNDDKGLGRTYVAVSSEDETTVYGYYTLSSGTIQFDTIPEKLPRYPIPVVLLARLAVDQSVGGQGFGRILLTDALRRSIRLADQLGIYAVEVQALDETAKAFYLKFGFKELSDDQFHLYIAMKTLRKVKLYDDNRDH
jgi:GNAT superfamily N-acetyltransferase